MAYGSCHECGCACHECECADPVGVEGVDASVTPKGVLLDEVRDQISGLGYSLEESTEILQKFLERGVAYCLARWGSEEFSLTPSNRNVVSILLAAGL